MDNKYIWSTVIIVLLMIFCWCYINSNSIHNYTKEVEKYTSTIDSLETRVAKLEYFIENEPKTININVTTKNK